MEICFIGNKYTFVAVGIIQIRFLTEFDELKNKAT